MITDASKKIQFLPACMIHQTTRGCLLPPLLIIFLQIIMQNIPYIWPGQVLVGHSQLHWHAPPPAQQKFRLIRDAGSLHAQ